MIFDVWYVEVEEGQCELLAFYFAFAKTLTKGCVTQEHGTCDKTKQISGLCMNLYLIKSIFTKKKKAIAANVCVTVVNVILHNCMHIENEYDELRYT